MAKYLVIVESPAKVKTIKKFLGKNYEVVASNGHVRDLPKSQMGIDIENDFEPKYITIRGKGDILAKLRKEAKKASESRRAPSSRALSCAFSTMASRVSAASLRMAACFSRALVGYLAFRLYGVRECR